MEGVCAGADDEDGGIHVHAQEGCTTRRSRRHHGGSMGSGGGLTLSWPVVSAGYTVMTTTNLAGGVWIPVSVTPEINGSQWQVNRPVSDGEQFFQLQSGDSPVLRLSGLLLKGGPDNVRP